uniref:ML domain-containing protein n=1 Tax=Panagrellus redivivus TaxID=6233 RepID=A0A7E4V8G1_PANRE
MTSFQQKHCLQIAFIIAVVLFIDVSARKSKSKTLPEVDPTMELSHFDLETEYAQNQQSPESVSPAPSTQNSNTTPADPVHGTRFADEFDPETMFADDSAEDEYDCTTFPNKTMTRPHFFSCNSPVRPPILVMHDSAVANSTGDYQFPLDFSQTVRFFFDITSFATRRYDNLRAEVYIYRRKTGWLGCGWLFMPTFGIIDNYDVCDDNLSCPIYPGRQVIEVAVKPRIAFSGIFKMLHNKNLPYQVIVRLVNNRAPAEELMCVVYQSRIDF